ncbi:MAG: DMT family transporter [Ilumatobacteraceae bacterium]
MPKNQRVIGMLCVLLSSTGFATVPTFAKKLYAHETNAMGVMSVRFTLATLLMLAIRSIMVRNTPWPSLKNTAKLLLWGVCIMGISLTYFIAINDIDTGLAIVLFYANPLFIIVGSWIIWKKRPSKNVQMSLVFTMIGVFITVGQIGNASIGAVALVLLSAVLFTIYLLGLSHSLERTDVITSVVLVNAGGAISYWFLVVTSPGSLTSEFPHDSTAWLLIAGLVIFGTVTPILASFAGLKRVGPSTVSVLATFEPVIAIIAGVIFLGEDLTLNRVLGASFVIGALIALPVLEARTEVLASLGVTSP